VSDPEHITLLTEIRDLLWQQVDFAQQTLKNQECRYWQGKPRSS
jgi:hypothetical protein